MPSFRRKTKKDGSTTYTWRGRVPCRTEKGGVEWRYVERGTSARTLAEARLKGREIEQEYHDALDLPLETASEPTFAEAAILYMEAGHARRYLPTILEHVGNMPLDELGCNQAAVQELARVAKAGCSPSTINTHIYTPLLAVLNFAAGLGMCAKPRLKRPKGHDKPPRLEIPDEAWYEAVLPHLPAHHKALMLLLTLHGLRVSEGLDRVLSDYDDARGELTVPDSKTGDAYLIKLSAPVIEAIRAIPRHKQKRRLFGVGVRANFLRAVRKAAKAAGVRTYKSHAFGRHAFSVRVLRAGHSLKFLKEAGRWKTIKMPAERYGHLEQSEVNEGVNLIAVEWAASPEKTKKRG